MVIIQQLGKYYFWIPQGLILGLLLIKIFLCDLFCDNIYFANYADNITPYIAGDSTTEVLRSLSSLAQKLFTWFTNN